MLCQTCLKMPYACKARGDRTTCKQVVLLHMGLARGLACIDTTNSSMFMLCYAMLCYAMLCYAAVSHSCPMHDIVQGKDQKVMGDCASICSICSPPLTSPSHRQPESLRQHIYALKASWPTSDKPRPCRLEAHL